MRTLRSIVLVAALAACTSERAPAPAEKTEAPSDVATGAPSPERETPAASAPDASPAPAPQPDGAETRASFSGYGDIRFGTLAADMGKAWGGELKEVGKDFNERCYFMTPAWVQTTAEFNFMISEGKFARVGSESAKQPAPGGGMVGMTRAQLAALYTGIEEQPHHYTDGLYLRIKDAAGGPGVLVFEIDGKGDRAKVTEWRVGLPPEVDYVEGCS